MALTDKQEKFCQLVADNNTQADAYRGSYNADNMKTDTIYKRASELMADGEIKGRVSELRNAISEANLWNRIDSLKVLAEIASGDDLEAKTGDKINAVKAINQMNGWDKQIIDHTSSDGSLSPSIIRIVAPDDHG